MHSPFERSEPAESDRLRIAWAAWPADLATPVQAFLSLRAAGHRVCLLESVEGPARLARYSFLAVDPTASLRCDRSGNVLRRADAADERIEGAPHEALRKVARRTQAVHPANLPPSLPPFRGGWIGWLAYEWATRLEPRVPRARNDPWNVPDATFDLYEDVVAFDHASQRVFVVVPCPDGARGHAAAQERATRLAADALEGDARASGTFRLQGSFEARTEPAEFRRGVETLRNAIAAGDIFQGVLSQRFEQHFSGDPFTAYRVLRLVNPSPHMFYFEADGLTLIGSSPERLVGVRGGRAENRPIAGTRPRSSDSAEDERLGEELLGDPKERAEHDMLVDLARNDLGRVARTGTVRVKEHMQLERFARVQHLVSRVECELASGRDALDALAAAFPAGTVSGAPKVRAMQLIAEVERDTRGPYAGCFGYLDAAGNLDTALCLRTFVARDGVLSVQSGAGIVYDSDPEAELRETLHKAGALFEAAARADSDSFRTPAQTVQR